MQIEKFHKTKLILDYYEMTQNNVLLPFKPPKKYFQFP